MRIINRRWLWAGALLTAAGAPVAITSSDDVQEMATGAWQSVAGKDEQTLERMGVTAEFPARPAPPLVDPIEGPPAGSLAEVFRFDVTTAWVMGRWPRVTTGLSQLDLQGYRVPLVTGTREHDLAGALTYYFNRGQRVEKITFRGTTGDARPLVATMAQRHGLLRQPHADPAVHLYRTQPGQQTNGQLQIRPARIVRRDLPHARFEVELELNRATALR